MKIKIILLILFFAVSTLACKSQNAPLKTLSTAQWQQDVDYFASKLVKKHGNLFHSLSKQEFDADIIKLKADLPLLQPHEVYVRLLQITSKVGDGHTYIPTPDNFKLYPLSLFWYDKDLYVRAASSDYKDAAGKKLVRIGNFPIEEVQKKLENTVLSKHENHWYVLHNSTAAMVRPEILHAIGIVPDTNRTNFVFQDDEGKQTTLNIAPVAINSNITWARASKAVPLYQQRQLENFWFTYLPELNAVYVNFRKYDNLSQNVKKLFDFIAENKASRLIIDMRQNQGGDFTKVRKQLIPKIKDNQLLNQSENLFVITGRRTFSAALANAIDFKKQTNATVIGEPPGERPNSWSENDEFTLPNSKLVVSYSTKYYKFLDEDVTAFEPDIRVDPDWQAHKEGKDSVLEKIKELIRSRPLLK